MFSCILVVFIIKKKRLDIKEKLNCWLIIARKKSNLVPIKLKLNHDFDKIY